MGVCTFVPKYRIWSLVCVVVAMTIMSILLETYFLKISLIKCYVGCRKSKYRTISTLSTKLKNNSISVSNYIRRENFTNSLSMWRKSSSIHVSSVSCTRLISGDKSEANKSYAIMNRLTPLDIVPFFELLRITKDCDAYRKRREYVVHSMSQEEVDFPIAFSIMVFKDFAQFERLLRAIYRPHNFYCIHCDGKSKPLFQQQVRQLVSCFPNVEMAPNNILVRWGNFSVLQADMICMEDLLKHKSWKYFINLTGQEFPLKTNWQLVKILKSYKGANDISGSILRRDDRRFKNKDKAPHNITVVKGPVHMAGSRALIEFLFTSKQAYDFLVWVNGTYVPDETYFPTIQNNKHLGAPGAFGGGAELLEKEVTMVRYKLWFSSSEKCHGKRVRLICVFNIGDLPNLVSAKQLFANKFHKNYGQHAFDCLEEWHRNRTRDEYLGLYKFDASGYSELTFVKHRANLN